MNNSELLGNGKQNLLGHWQISKETTIDCQAMLKM